MRNSAFSSLTLLLLACCSCAALSDAYRPAGDGSAFPSPWFAPGAARNLFTASADMYGYHVSGLMVVSAMASGGHRVVMMTEFGLKMLDMEFGTGGSFTLHYCMEALDRKVITAMLKKDFRMLTAPATDMAGVKVMSDRRSGETVLKVPVGGQRYYCHLHPQTGKPVSVIRTTALTSKARADFYSSPSGRLDSIRLSHDNRKINLKLSRIDEIQSPFPQ